MQKKMLLIVYLNSLKVKVLISFMILLILNQVLKNQLKQLKKVVHGLFLVDFAQDSSKETKNVAERKAKLVLADLGRYWIGAEQAQLKTFVQNHLHKVQNGLKKENLNHILIK